MSLYLFLSLPLFSSLTSTDFGQLINARIELRVPILGKKLSKNDENFLFWFFYLSLSTADFCFLFFDGTKKGRNKNILCSMTCGRKEQKMTLLDFDSSFIISEIRER